MSDQYIGHTLAEKYRIDSLIRDGAANRLYRATHLSMDKPVTIKILAAELADDDEQPARFSAEAKKISTLAHPNILNAIDFGTNADGAAYIVFDGADGVTLAETLRKEGKLPVERAVRIAAQIAAALSAAHAHGSVHGNLNSENVLLVKNPNTLETAKLLDFGAPDAAENPVSLKNLQYQSPEQNSLGATPDARSDIYALGVIFYEMLANEVPFAAGTRDELLIKQASNPPAPLSAFRTDIVPDIEPVVLKALAKNPELRYQTAREFAEDLHRATNTTVSAENFIAAPLLAEETEAGSNNNLWKTAFIVLAGVSLLSVAFIYMTTTKQTNPTTTTMLQSDANGQPVQPINPATGMNEQGTAGLIPYNQGQAFGNSNMPLSSGAPQPVPNGDGYGDGYNPWGRGGVPPAGAPPQQIAPNGQYVDPNNQNSIFMQDGIIYERVPVNGNVSVKPTPTGKPTPANVNANTAPAPTPANPAVNPSPNSAKTPTAPIAKPSPKPTAAPPTAAPKPPSATQKETTPSGKEQDS